MIEQCTTSLLRRPVALSMALAVMVGGGCFSLWQLPLDIAPNVEYPALSVQTSWPGTSAETVEMVVTSPIEGTASTVAGVRNVTSVSSEGYSRVDVECDQETRMDYARLELNEKLGALRQKFPDGVGSPAVEACIPEEFTDTQGFIRYSLTGEKTASALRTLGRDVLAPRLRSTKGVADVRVEGGEEEEVRIELDRESVVSLGVQPGSVVSALGSLALNTPVGTLHDRDRRMVVSLRLADSSLEAIARTPVARTPSGMPVLLRDVGTVRLTPSQPYGYYRINGKPTVTLVIAKERHANALRVADRVFERIEELRPSLPEGVEITLESDRSAVIRSELTSFARDGVFSVFCIALVLLFFLGNIRAPLLVLTSIGLSLAGTFLLFQLLGIGLHLLSLAGLVLGFGRLVDDSIVVLDTIQRRVGSVSDRRAISRAVGEIALPVVASTVTTVSALLPTLFLPPALRAYLIDFSFAVGISLLMSLVISFTLIPVATSRIRLDAFLPGVYARIEWWSSAAYSWCLRRVVAHRLTAVLSLLWMFGLPVWLLPERLEGTCIAARTYNALFGCAFYRSVRPYINSLLGGSSHLFFVKVSKREVWVSGRETYLLVRVKFRQGTDLRRYDEVARSVERAALAFGNQVGNVTCQVTGHSTYVRIEVPDSLASSTVPFSIKSTLTVLAARTGGASIGVWGFGPGFSSGGESVPSFAVKVLGYNYRKVKMIAETLRQRLEANPRIADVDIDRSWTGEWGNATEIDMRVDLQEAARYGVDIADVINTIRSSTPGALQANRVTLHGEWIPVVVKIKGYQEYGVEDLRKAVVTGRDGQEVCLGTLLTVNQERTPGEILREDQSYVRWVTFEYRGPFRFGEAFVDETLRSIPLPHGYRFDRSLSWFTFSDADKHTMLLIAGAALLIVFMVTASLYESFQKPFLVILSIPFSLIGLFLAFYLTDTPFGRGGYASVILLIGIVTTNSIVLVDALARACPGRGKDVEALITAATSRLRPVLMTTLTTIGGLLPMLLLGDRSSIWYPLAVGTTGGLLSSMVLTLLVVPAMYLNRDRCRSGHSSSAPSP